MIEYIFFIDLLYALFYRLSSTIIRKENEIRRTIEYIYLIFFIGIFSREESKIMINEIRGYSMDMYLVYFIGILSREEGKVTIEFLSRIFYRFTMYNVSSSIVNDRVQEDIRIERYINILS